MDIDTNVNISLKKNYEIHNIKPFENVKVELNETNRYIIYEFDNEHNGTIYIYFNDEYLNNAIISAYSDAYKIYINEQKGELLYFNEQKTYNKNKFLTFKAFSGKMYFVISNYNNDFSNTIYIMNNFGFTDITNYEVYQYTYNFETINNPNEERIITFSFKNDIKQKNYLYYQLKSNNASYINDYTIIKTKLSEMFLNIENEEIIDISNFRNETINIQFNFSSLYTIDSIELLIFYSEYRNIFVTNPYVENYALEINSIKNRTFYVFIDLSKATSDIYVKMKTITKEQYKYNYMYFFKPNKIKEIEKNIESGQEYTYGSIKNGNYYDIHIYNYNEYFKSIILFVELDAFTEIYVNFFKSSLLKLYEENQFMLDSRKSYVVFEYNKKSLELSNNNDNANDMEKSGMFFIYFESNYSSLLKIDIYKNYSDIYIDEFKGEVKDSFYSIELGKNNHLELDNLSDKFYIVVSHFKYNSYNLTDISMQFISENDYYDITYIDFFKFNFKFNMTKEKRSLSYRINTDRANNKYLHFQLYNHKSKQKENFTFKTLSGQNIISKNNCINLIDNKNQIILMNFGLSSDESMDNYDIIIRQSNYSLIHPFNETNIIEIPFIKSYTLYLYSDLSENDGYEFIFNNNQEEVEYYYLKTDEFNENKIDINSLESEIAKTKKKDNVNTTDIFNTTDEEIKSFIIEKDSDKNKAVVMKIKINGLIDFKIFRDKYIKEPNHTFIIIISAIISIFIIIIIGFLIIKLIKKCKNNNRDIEIINNNENLINNVNNEENKSTTNGNNSIELNQCSNDNQINDYTPNYENNKEYQNYYNNSNAKNYFKPKEMDFNENLDGMNTDTIGLNNSERYSINNFAPPPVDPDFIKNHN